MEEYCHLHHGVPATSRCHACGKPLCKDCLSEEREHQFCADPSCQAVMVRHDALLADKNVWVEEQLQKTLKTFNARVLGFLAFTWIVATPVFVYLGSDGWTANFGIASAMGPLGALVLCLQMNSLIGIYRRKHLERRRGEMIEAWDNRPVGME